MKDSPRNSPQQSAIAEGFAEVNSVFIVITSAKILPRWLFPSKIYIQFTIFNTYFSTKLSFTKEISLARAREAPVCATRSQINYIFSAVYSSSFSSFTWQWNKLCLHVLYPRIGEIQLSFCFILLPFVHLPAVKKNKTCDIKQNLFI